MLLYIDVISLILGKDFREGVSIVPLMLLSYMLLGMQFNVSMWYKLSGKTSVAIWITLSGLAVTAAVNILFMPKFSYHAAAWGHLASYVVMFVINVALGNRYYPIPYKWGRIITVFVAMFAVYGLSMLSGSLFFRGVSFESSVPMMMLKLAVNTVLILAYAGFVYVVLWRKKTVPGRARPQR